MAYEAHLEEWVDGHEDRAAFIARLKSPWGIEAFKAQVNGANNCAHPLRLKGHVETYDSETGEQIRTFDSRELPNGVLLKACGNRRATRCPPCAEVYREDARHLVKAGLRGGKGVPESVRERLAILVTMTGPSFGAVHSAGKDKPRPCHPSSPAHRCPHGEPVSCFLRHERDEAIVGEPLCDKCYQYRHHVIWNALASELFRRTTIYVARHLAGCVGITEKQLKSLVKLEYVRVAEFQRRGVVHFHVIVRADGADGPGSPPPQWLSADLLMLAIRSATHAVSVPFPVKLGGKTAHLARWGEMLDLSVVADERGQRRASGYLANYAEFPVMPSLGRSCLFNALPVGDFSA